MNKETIIAAIDAALVTRGKHKGLLKRACPPMGTDGAAAWQALTLLANPYKASLYQIAFFNERQCWIYRNILKALDGLDLRLFDRDRVALEIMGVW